MQVVRTIKWMVSVLIRLVFLVSPGYQAMQQSGPIRVTRLLEMMWGWPIEIIDKNIAAIVGADIDILKKIAKQ